jgi:hypothetical protein
MEKQLPPGHHGATMDRDDESMPRSAGILVRAIWKF